MLEDVIELLIYHQPGVKPSLTLLVFEGPVRSGFQLQKWSTGNRNHGFGCPFWGATAPNRYEPVLFGSLMVDTPVSTGFSSNRS
jgi:hypothetical protein